jgi:hypothetical protein
MAASVSGLFLDKQHVDSAVGALRASGLVAARITVFSPEGQRLSVGEAAHERQSIAAWFAEHLVRRGHPHPQEEASAAPAATGGWLVRVDVASVAEERDVRTTLMAAGATEMSSATDGKMIPVQQPEGTGLGAR